MKLHRLCIAYDEARKCGLRVIAIGFVRGPIARSWAGGIPHPGRVFCAALIINARLEVMGITFVTFWVVFGVYLAISIDIISQVDFKGLGRFSCG